MQSHVFLFGVTLRYVGKLQTKIPTQTSNKINQFADADIAFVIAVALYAFAALWELFLQTYFGQRIQDEVISY